MWRNLGYIAFCDCVHVVFAGLFNITEVDGVVLEWEFVYCEVYRWIGR